MKILYIALAILLASTVDASVEVFDSVVSKTAKVFASVRTVTFVIGGFGLVGVAAGAIFGQVKWRWVAALAIGLATLAVAGGVVDYVTGTSTGTGNYADTLK